MDPWDKKDRRKCLRYEVTLSAKALRGLMASAVPVTSHDISTNGAGFFTDRQLSPGETVEIMFTMPDNAEQILVRGTVVWVTALGQERFRAGVAFAEDELKPIPMVLRSIKVRTSRYSC